MFGIAGAQGRIRVHTASGEADPSFGTSGEAALPCPADFEPDEPCSLLSGGHGLALAPDGDVVVAAIVTRAPYPDVRSSRLTIWRLDREGRPDQGFGVGGQVDADGLGGFATRVFVQPDGRIVAVAAPASSDPTLVVLRYLQEGTPDSSFGSDGRISLSGAGGAFFEMTPEGAMVIGGSWPARLTRLLPDGGVDGTFAANSAQALRTLARLPGEGISLADAVVAPDGRIRIAVEQGAYREDVTEFAVLGLLPDGRLDRAFGRRGLARVSIPRRDDFLTAQAIALDARGALLVGGATGPNELFAPGHLAIARFRASGQPDLSFGVRGVATAESANGSAALAVAPDGQILSAGHDQDRYGFNAIDLVRLHGGYDDAPPRILTRTRCARGRATVLVRITDRSGLSSATARAAGRRLRTTDRKRFRVTAPAGTRRLTLIAEDLAGNTARRGVRLGQRCSGSFIDSVSGASM